MYRKLVHTKIHIGLCKYAWTMEVDGWSCRVTPARIEREPDRRILKRTEAARENLVIPLDHKLIGILRLHLGWAARIVVLQGEYGHAVAGWLPTVWVDGGLATFDLRDN